MLSVRDLTAGYGGPDILHGVTVEVREGEVVSVIGPNGAGKSTLLKAITGLATVRSGAIDLGGRPLGGIPTHALVDAGIAFVPQGQNVFPSLTVRENLDLGVYREGGRAAPGALDRVFARFPALKARLGQRAGTLSGGERQMLAIGRALLPAPRLLLLDEPSLGLAPKLVEVLFEAVAAIGREGVLVLMVEQNARRALVISSRTYVLELGRNRFEGDAAALLDDPRVRALYLGG